MPGAFSSGFSSGFGTGKLSRTATGLLFRDRFDRQNGAVGANWTLLVGNHTWTIENGEAKGTSGSGSSWIGPASIGGLTETVQQALVRRSGEGKPGLLFWYTSGAQAYYLVANFTATGSREELWGQAPGGGEGGLQLGAVHGLATMHYKVHRKGGRIRAWRDAGAVASIDYTNAGLNAVALRPALYNLTGNGAAGQASYFNEYVACASNDITVTGLPTGYKVRLGGVGGVTSAAAVAGVPLVVDALHLTFPITTLEILDASNNVVAIEASEVWGGDAWTFSPSLTYSATGSGGITIGGSAVVAGRVAYAAQGSGGVIVAGTAMPALGRAIVGSGGVVVGGSAIATRRQSWIGTGGISIGGAAVVTTDLLNFRQYGVRDYTGTGVVGDREPGTAVAGTEIEREGAAGVIVPRAEGAMGAKKAKPPRTPGGGKILVQHYRWRGQNLVGGTIRVGGASSYALIPSGAPLPPNPPLVVVGTGGIVVGGAASVSANIAQHFAAFGHGGVQIGGTAPRSVNNLPLPVARNFIGSGGVRVAGAATAESTLANHYGRVGTGGVKVAGAAVVSSSIRQRFNPITGGLILVRGSALVTRVINSGGGGTFFTTPVPPTTFDPSRNPAHFTSEVVAANPGDLQNKINTVPAGTRIRVPLGVDWPVVLNPTRALATGQWVEIAPDMDHAAIEAARAYGRRMNLGIAGTLGLPTLRNIAGAPVIQCGPGASGLRITGIQFRQGGLFEGAMIRLAYTAMSQASHAVKRMVMDRCTVVGGTVYPVNRAILLIGEQLAVLGCHIADVYGTQDNQGILTYGWQGPIVIKWNHIEGWGMGWMSGGAETAAGGVTSDVIFEENRVTKNLSYWYNPPFGSTRKNLLEAKSIRRASVKRNIFEHFAPDGQNFPVILKSVDQGGSQPQQGTIDYELAYNWFRKIPGGMNLSAQPQGGTPMSRVYIHDNLFEDVNTLADFDGNGTMLQLGGDLRNVTVDHNTFVKALVGGVSAVALEGVSQGPVAIRSNIFRMDGDYPLKRSGSGNGLPSWAAYVPDATKRAWLANVAVAIRTTGDYPPAADMPPGTIIRANDAAVGYADLAGGNYQVTGALATAGHDGLPVGISDYPGFVAALASVQNG